MLISNELGHQNNESQNSNKMAAFTVAVKNFLVKITLKLFMLSCYANAFEVVEKIVTNQKDYSKCSLCVIVCFIAKTHHQ